MSTRQDRPICGLWVVVCLAACCGYVAASEPLAREQLLVEVKSGSGLCVHLGSTDGAVEIAAAESGRMLVQGLARDEAALASARAAIEKSGRYGLASVVLYTGKERLPYRDNLVDRLVIADWNACRRQGLTEDEALRVVAPGGLAYLGSAGASFRRLTKLRPATMADWPTRMNETQGSLISRDSALKAPFELRWMDGTTLGLYAVNATLSSAGGRYFACTVWDAGNVGAARQEVVLVARNAFNGLPLWRRFSGIAAGRYGVCAVGDMVFVGEFVAMQRNVVGLDAASGEQVCTIPLGTNELLGWAPAGDAIILALKPGKASLQPPQLLCADSRTGAVRWTCEGASWPFLVAGDVVYTAGAKIAALDAKTGAVRWQADPPPLGESTQLVPAKAVPSFVEAGFLVVATKSHLAAYATADGAIRWSFQVPPPQDGRDTAVYRPGPYPWQGGVVLGAKRYDPATGKEQGNAPAPFGARCMPRVVCANYTIGIAKARDLGFLSEPSLTEIVRFTGMDSICSIGLMVANGMMYSGPSFCNCVKGKIEGFPAFGTAGVRIAEADVVAPRPVVTGKGGERPFDTAADSADWPIYRHDIRRSAATPASAPKSLNLLWDRSLGTLPAGVIAEGWKSRVSIGLSAPTVAAGRVFVADAEGHRVLALSAKDGQTLWSFRTGGRVDTPPTIHQGRCLFGCRDGWVYCLRTDDGALVWRTRAAPAEQYVVAFGQVESAWPVPGSVAVQDDLVLLGTGRAHGVDGGLPFVALRLADGSTAWVRNRGYINDVPIGDGTSLYIGGIKVGDEDLHGKTMGAIVGAPAESLLLDLKRRDQLPLLIGPRPGLADAGTMLQPPWDVHAGQIRSHAWFYRGHKGALLAFDSGCLYTATVAAWAEKNAKNSAAVILAAYPTDRAEPIWSQKLPFGQRINGLAVTADALGVCGNLAPPERRGFVRIVAKDSGATVAEHAFDGAANWDPMAITAGTIYLSTGDGRVLCIGESR